MKYILLILAALTLLAPATGVHAQTVNNDPGLTALFNSLGNLNAANTAINTGIQGYQAALNANTALTQQNATLTQQHTADQQQIAALQAQIAQNSDTVIVNTIDTQCPECKIRDSHTLVLNLRGGPVTVPATPANSLGVLWVYAEPQ